MVEKFELVSAFDFQRKNYIKLKLFECQGKFMIDTFLTTFTKLKKKLHRAYLENLSVTILFDNEPFENINWKNGKFLILDK